MYTSAKIEESPMRHMKGLLFSLGMVLMFVGSSFAGTVSMNFNSVGGQSIGGEYVYQYYFYVNGSTSLTPLLCDTYSNSIYFGESWNATTSSLTSGAGIWMGLPNAMQDYQAAAIIFGEMLNGTVDYANGNLAIWALFDGGRNNSGWTPYDQMLINNALYLTAFNGANYYNQFTLYTPVGGSPGNGPQEFIGYNGGGIPPALPEPASLPILAGGLVTMVGVLRRTVRV
jgi:hypothetical protein